MNWRERYRQLDAIAGAAMTFHGRDAAGASVVIHLLEPAGYGASQALLHQLMSLAPAAWDHVREIGADGDRPYVITDDYFGAAALEEWLRRARAPEERPSPPRSTVPEPPPPLSGEFTRIFGPAPTAAPVESKKAAPEPGEFTRLFRSAVESPQARSVPAAGEITELFRTPPPEPVPPVLPLPAPALQPAAPAPPPASGPEPGDFTRLLGAPAPKAVPVAVPAAPPPPPPAPAAAPAPAMSEYTRIIAAPPPAPRPAAPQPPPPTAPKPSTPIAPIAVFATLGALALLLILFFALRR